MNSLEPSLVRSVISAYLCVSRGLKLAFRCFKTYQVEDARRSGLVLGALGHEKQTLAGLGGPGSGGVCDGGLLVLVEDRELLSLNRLIAEVEEALREAETPMRKHLC